MLFFRSAELEHKHSVDGSAILQVFEEKMGFWQSSCLSLPFLVSDGFSLKTVVKTTLACAVESLAAIKIARKAADVFEGVRFTVVVSCYLG